MRGVGAINTASVWALEDLPWLMVSWQVPHAMGYIVRLKV